MCLELLKSLQNAKLKWVSCAGYGLNTEYWWFLTPPTPFTAVQHTVHGIHIGLQRECFYLSAKVGWIILGRFSTNQIWFIFEWDCVVHIQQHLSDSSLTDKEHAHTKLLWRWLQNTDVEPLIGKETLESNDSEDEVDKQPMIQISKDTLQCVFVSLSSYWWI